MRVASKEMIEELTSSLEDFDPSTDIAAIGLDTTACSVVALDENFRCVENFQTSIIIS